MSCTSPIDIPRTPTLGSPLRSLPFRGTSELSATGKEEAGVHGHGHDYGHQVEGWQGVILSPSPSPDPAFQPGYKSPPHCTGSPSMSPFKPPPWRLPHIFRPRIPALPPLDTLPCRKHTPTTSPPSSHFQALTSPYTLEGPSSHQTRYSHAPSPPTPPLLHQHHACVHGDRECEQGRGASGEEVHTMWRTKQAHSVSLPSIQSLGREYSHLHVHPHHHWQYPTPNPHSLTRPLHRSPSIPPPPHPTPPHHQHALRHTHGHQCIERPRLHIHPYAPPAHPSPGGGDRRYYSAEGQGYAAPPAHLSPGGGDRRYYSAGGMGSRGPCPDQGYGHGHGHGFGPPGVGGRLSVGGVDKERDGSPASTSSPGGSFRSPRRRMDDVQLSILTEVFDRTSYPTTEERDALARQLGMTSRSVQIWFQNKRRAVKVDQQSALQRAELKERMQDRPEQGWDRECQGGTQGGGRGVHECGGGF